MADTPVRSPFSDKDVLGVEDLFRLREKLAVDDALRSQCALCVAHSEMTRPAPEEVDCADGGRPMLVLGQADGGRSCPLLLVVDPGRRCA